MLSINSNLAGSVWKNATSIRKLPNVPLCFYLLYFLYCALIRRTYIFIGPWGHPFFFQLGFSLFFLQSRIRLKRHTDVFYVLSLQIESTSFIFSIQETQIACNCQSQQSQLGPFHSSLTKKSTHKTSAPKKPSNRRF